MEHRTHKMSEIFRTWLTWHLQSSPSSLFVYICSYSEVLHLSILPRSSPKHFQSIQVLSNQLVSYKLWSKQEATAARSKKKKTTTQNTTIQEMTASLAAANNVSMAAPLANLSLELDCIFACGKDVIEATSDASLHVPLTRLRTNRKPRAVSTWLH